MVGEIERALQQPYPGYFALVMATGIVSIAAQYLGIPVLAWILLGGNVLFYLSLWLLALIGLARYRGQLVSALADHQKSPGFLTLVAGTCILGSQVALLGSLWGLSAGLWFLGLALWVILMYAVLTQVIVEEKKPAIGPSISGAWLLFVVSTQAVSGLGSLIAPHLPWTQGVLLFTLLLYLLGGMLYLLLTAIILYRLIFIPLTPADFTPPHWVDMGGAAITVLAGSLLMLAAPHSDLLQELLPFLRGSTFWFWAAGTFWIPLLFLLEIWRLGVKRAPVRYHPAYWSMVFPLGMYTACTFQLGHATGLPYFAPIAHAFFYLALLAWLIVLVGLAVRLARILLPGTPA